MIMTPKVRERYSIKTAAALILLNAALFGCAVVPPPIADVANTDEKAVTYVSPEVVRRMQQEGTVILIDASGLASGPARIPGAVNMEIQDPQKARYPVGVNIVIYHSGFSNKASRAAAVKFAGSGAKVAVMDGGLLAWIRAGYPVYYPNEIVAPIRISSDELRRATRDEDKFLLLDLRSEREFSISHVEGARNLDVGKISQESAKWPKDRWIVIYDEAGIRAELLANELRRKGFPYAGFLVGGYDGWLKASTTKTN